MDDKKERAKHLEDLISQAFDIIQDLEQSLLVSDEPIERRRWKMQIKERRVDVEEWENELNQITSTTTTTTTVTVTSNDQPASPSADTTSKPEAQPQHSVEVEQTVVEQTVVNKPIETQPATQPQPTSDLPGADLVHTLQGHTKEVTRLAFSPDGTILVSTSDDATVRLWEVATGKALRTLDQGNQFDGSVQDVKFVPNSKLVAGVTQFKVLIWNALSGVLQNTLKIHSTIFNTIESLDFTQDGTLMALSISNGANQLWKTSNWSQLGTVKNKGFMIMGGNLAFSLDGQVLATTSVNANKLWLWRVADGSLLHTLEGQAGNITDLAFSPDNTLLASASEDKSVRLWNVRDGTPQFVIQAHTEQARAVAFSPNGQFLASGSDDKTIKLWRIADGSALATLEGHAGGLNCVLFSPDGTLLASASDDKTIRLWKIK